MQGSWNYITEYMLLQGRRWMEAESQAVGVLANFTLSSSGRSVGCAHMPQVISIQPGTIWSKHGRGFFLSWLNTTYNWIWLHFGLGRTSVCKCFWVAPSRIGRTRPELPQIDVLSISASPLLSFLLTENPCHRCVASRSLQFSTITQLPQPGAKWRYLRIIASALTSNLYLVATSSTK